MPIRAEGTIDSRIVRKKWAAEEGAHCSEVLKTSIILASNNEGQTPKRIPERGRAKKDIEVRSRARKVEKDKCEGVEGDGSGGKGRKVAWEKGREGGKRLAGRF